MQINVGVSVTGTAQKGGIPTHVFGLAGQSNMQGGPAFDGGASYPEGTLQWGRYGASNGELIPALGNLEHQGGYGENTMSLAVQFAIDYQAANPGVRIVFVPGAQGGTTYIGNDWNRGDPVYADFIARMNAVFSRYPNFALKGILWQHGETDAQNAGGSAYAANLDQMIADMRADIARASPSTPVLVGEIPPELADDGASHGAVLAAQSDVAGRVLHTAIATSSGLTTYDGVHYDAASLRTLGMRHAAALGAARLNDGSGINLLRDGGMDDPSQWVLSGVAVVAGGVGQNRNGKGHWRQTGVPLVGGKTYEVTWTVQNYTTGTTTPFFIGGTNANGTTVVGPGTHVQQLAALPGNTMFQLNCGGGSILDVDDLSIIEV